MSVDKKHTRIRVQFSTIPAANYENKDTGCSAINKNDYLGKIIFYNGKGNLISNQKRYTCIVFLDDGEGEPHDIKFDEKTDTLSVDLEGQYCMSKIRMIEFHSYWFKMI